MDCGRSRHGDPGYYHSIPCGHQSTAAPNDIMTGRKNGVYVMATWREILHKLNNMERTFPKHLDDAAMIRREDALVECDIYRSLTTGRLMFDLAYLSREAVEAEMEENGEQDVTNRDSG